MPHKLGSVFFAPPGGRRDTGWYVRFRGRVVAGPKTFKRQAEEIRAEFDREERLVDEMPHAKGHDDL